MRSCCASRTASGKDHHMRQKLNLDQTLVVVMICLWIFAITATVYEHYHNRAQVRRGIIAAIRANCLQADALLRASVDDRQLSEAQRVRINKFVRGYYLPLNEALDDLHSRRCPVPSV